MRGKHTAICIKYLRGCAVSYVQNKNCISILRPCTCSKSDSELCACRSVPQEQSEQYRYINRGDEFRCIRSCENSELSSISTYLLISICNGPPFVSKIVCPPDTEAFSCKVLPVQNLVAVPVMIIPCITFVQKVVLCGTTVVLHARTKPRVQKHCQCDQL